jgi:hypothetical protein
MPSLPYRGMKKKRHLFRKYDIHHGAGQQAPQCRTGCTTAHHGGAPWCTTQPQAVLQLPPARCNAVLILLMKAGRSPDFMFLFVVT